MEITGVTRIKDGKETEEFVVGCSEHNYWYKGLPPLTHGCRECWMAYFFANWALSGSDESHVDMLEAPIRHASELIEKGKWDFKPEFDVKIENEED